MASPETFTVGWICPLQDEYEAACAMLDEDLDGPEAAEKGDGNTYAFGRISKHNVVIACLPLGRYGTNAATRVAKDMMRSFPQLRFLLLVGTAGGAPTQDRDIRLGDVVVSVPTHSSGGVVQYDYGKHAEVFHVTSQLNAPPTVLLGALPEVSRRHNYPKRFKGMDEHLQAFNNNPRYQKPQEDRLFLPAVRHQGGKDCSECNMNGLVQRPPRTTGRAVNVFYGNVASGNSIVMDAGMRDSFAKSPRVNAFCYEMEAAGLMNDFPCMVIRGISNYADAHKNDEWRCYAAATAAAYAKELLCVVRPVKAAASPMNTMSKNFTLGTAVGHFSYTEQGDSR
ncbi:nucleoside phosphorylase domain-containing protein [Trichoderma aethiopicum]